MVHEESGLIRTDTVHNQLDGVTLRNVKKYNYERWSQSCDHQRRVSYLYMRPNRWLETRRVTDIMATWWLVGLED